MTYLLFRNKIKEYIGKWEDCTGCKIEGAQYQIILFYAGENAPSWNNLSLDINTALKLYTGCKSNDYSIFKQIFESLYHPNMQPLELYIQGVNRYLELKGKATPER